MYHIIKIHQLKFIVFVFLFLPSALFSQKVNQSLLESIKKYEIDFNKKNLIAAYSQAINAEPNNSSYYRGRSYLYFQLGNEKYPPEKTSLDKAFEDINRAIQLDPDSAYYYNEKGFYFQYGNYDYISAIQTYTIGITKDSLFSKCFYNRAHCKASLSDYRGAINDYTFLMHQFPNSSVLFEERASAYKQSNQFSKALSDYDKAIILNPTDCHLFIKRGKVKILINDKNSACTDYSKAGELGCWEAYEIIKRECN
jgi:tetratricopeptide (TPR) repeat protein